MMIFLVIILSFFLPVFAGASVVINEVLFDPLGTDTGFERIEIYNAGGSPENLSDWQLYPDGIGYFSFSQGFILDPQKFVSVHLRVSGTNSVDDLYHSSASGNMGNTSGSAALFSGEPRGKDTIKSFVQWGRAGETWESAAADAGVWIKGEFIDLSTFSEGNSVTLRSDGVTSGESSDWKIGSPTPRAENSGTALPLSPSPSSTPLSSVPSSQSSSGGFVTEKTISAYAGEDKKAVAGSGVEFLGYAKGLNGEPLENARFWWNFGDGGTKEGRAVSHIFSIPGKYTVGLHVSSGHYTASDYLLVEVLSNLVKIESVVESKEGYVKIKNPSGAEMDLGGWFLSDGKLNFFIPPRTKIGTGAEVSFPNEITGLLTVGGVNSVFLSYSNGTVADEWKKESVAPVESPSTPVVSAVVASEEKETADTVVAGAAPPPEMPVKFEEKTAVVGISNFFGGKIFLALAFILALFSSAAFILSKRFVS